jgi:hypothetical protein
MSEVQGREPDPPEIVAARLERLTALRLSGDASGKRAVAALRRLAEQLETQRRRASVRRR